MSRPVITISVDGLKKTYLFSPFKDRNPVKSQRGVISRVKGYMQTALVFKKYVANSGVSPIS